MVVGILPRGPGDAANPPNFTWPSVYTRSQRLVNKALRVITWLPPSWHYLDCGARFIAANRTAIDAALMPDATHPSATGYELLADCLDPLVTQLMRVKRRPAGL